MGGKRGEHVGRAGPEKFEALYQIQSSVINIFLLKINNNNLQVTLIYIAIEYLNKHIYFI
jgi:hypothetical protein